MQISHNYIQNHTYIRQDIPNDRTWPNPTWPDSFCTEAVEAIMGRRPYRDEIITVTFSNEPFPGATPVERIGYPVVLVPGTTPKEFTLLNSQQRWLDSLGIDSANPTFYIRFTPCNAS